MLDQATWAPVVTAAFNDYLAKKTGGKMAAVPAAPLKPLVARRAEEAGLEFPPVGYENRKFVDFLNAVPSVVATKRRTGQDVLVAPADQLELFDTEIIAHTEPVRQRSGLRADVFSAFTKIPSQGHQYWYSPGQDLFVELDSAPTDPELLAVPVETKEGAMEVRKSFAESLTGGERDRLLNALAAPSSTLGHFSKAVKELRLEHAWHVFRLNRLTQKVRTWADDQRLEWNPSWTDLNSPRESDANTISSRETNSFLAGLMQLGPEDAKRVLVPLDIVLKLMRRD